MNLKNNPSELLMDLSNYQICDKISVKSFKKGVNGLYKIDNQKYKDDYTFIVNKVVKDNVESFIERCSNSNSVHTRSILRKLFHIENIEIIKKSIINDFMEIYEMLNGINEAEFNSDINNILIIPPKDTNINRDIIEELLETL